MSDVTSLPPKSSSLQPAPRRRLLGWVLCATIVGLGGFQARALVGSHAGAGPREVDDPPPPADAKPTDAVSEPGQQEDEETAEAEGDEEPTLVPDKPLELEKVPAAAELVKKPIAPAGVELWRRASLVGGDKPHYSAKLADGRAASLTVDPHLQKTLSALLLSYKPMAGSVVAMDPRTGQILAMVEYSKDGHSKGLATRPLYPAASVFKIITGAALLEKGVSPELETCYHGGMHGLVSKLLKDKPRLDRSCVSLSMALAKSANVVFGKLAVRHLDAEALRREAEKFLFNRPIWSAPDAAGAEYSTAEIADDSDPLAFAKSAAGFGSVRMSPLHAAVIASAVANGGVQVEPTLVKDIDGAALPPQPSRRLLQADTAAHLRDMMKLTVSDGTARSSFRERRGWVLGDIEVSGKTGSLADRRPYKDYSWFVGFAPADNPTIAVAVVVVNSQLWRIKAPFVAREALRAYLLGGAVGQPPAVRARWHRRHHRVRHARR